MRCPGRTCSRLVPRLEIWFCTASVAPLPSVTMVMTALTPITMPRIVRKERIRLRRMARSAKSSVLSSINAPAVWQHRPDGVALVAGHHAIHKTHDAFGVGGHVPLVRDHEHGDALVHIQAPQQFHDFVTALRVEVAGGLVRQQHGRLGDDGAGNGHALLLAAGQFAGCGAPSPCQA